MNDPIADILADLPKIHQIALEPNRLNPLLSVVIQQAVALAKIADWSEKAHTGAQSAAAAMPDDHEEVPTPMNRAKSKTGA